MILSKTYWFFNELLKQISFRLQPQRMSYPATHYPDTHSHTKGTNPPLPILAIDKKVVSTIQCDNTWEIIILLVSQWPVPNYYCIVLRSNQELNCNLCTTIGGPARRQTLILNAPSNGKYLCIFTDVVPERWVKFVICFKNFLVHFSLIFTTVKWLITT